MTDLELAARYIARHCADAGVMLLALGIIESPSKRNRYGTQGCGTRAGFQRHKDRGQTPCDECREAQRTYMRDYQRNRYTPERRRQQYERAMSRGYYARGAA